MIPLVFSEHEIDEIVPLIEQAKRDICSEYEIPPKDLHCDIGTMIEVPRACLKADKIAGDRNISFVSFGSNDLTQLVLGLSRDDTQQFMVSI